MENTNSKSLSPKETENRKRKKGKHVLHESTKCLPARGSRAAGKEGELVKSQNSSCLFALAVSLPSLLGGPSGAMDQNHTQKLQKPQEETERPKKLLMPPPLQPPSQHPPLG
jgi:hypothetical protein